MDRLANTGTAVLRRNRRGPVQRLASCHPFAADPNTGGKMLAAMSCRRSIAAARCSHCPRARKSARGPALRDG